MASKKRRGRSGRIRIGDVSVYRHRASWWIYFRENGVPQRRRVGRDLDEAKAMAAEVNAKLAAGRRSMFSFKPVTVDELRNRFIDHHDHVIESSVGTVRRYRTAIEHLCRYGRRDGRQLMAHMVDAEDFAKDLRTVKVAPNGHPNSTKRLLTPKGTRFILASCRSMYHFAAKKHLLPPYTENPFAALPIRRMAQDGDDAEVRVFTADDELRFFAACNGWQFSIFYTLARTGLRPGELTHLLVDDFDLADGLLHVRSKPELGWRIKTRRPRSIPLPQETAQVLRRVVDGRRQGVLFLQRRCSHGRKPPLAGLGRLGLRAELERRVQGAEQRLGESLTRADRIKTAAGVWRDAGATSPDKVRNSFISVTKRIGLAQFTAPKVFRHGFATLMLEADIDPLVRQLTLGHAPSDMAKAALGMTSVYSHVRPEIHRQQLQRIVDLRPKTSGLVNRFLDEEGQC